MALIISLPHNCIWSDSGGLSSLTVLKAIYPLCLPVPVLSGHEETWARLLASSQQFNSQPKHMWVSVITAQTKGRWGVRNKATWLSVVQLFLCGQHNGFKAFFSLCTIYLKTKYKYLNRQTDHPLRYSADR